MNWTEHEHETRNPVAVTTEREAILEETKRDSLPIVIQEAGHDKGITPIKFQPVRSPGNFESEFALKDQDLIIHIWPWLHHEKERRGDPRPAFKPGLQLALGNLLQRSFDMRTVFVSEDRELNSIFIRIEGMGRNQFWRDLAIQTLTKLHQSLGGT